MVTLHSGKQIIIDNKRIASKEEAVAISQEEAFKNTLTYQVLKKHKQSEGYLHKYYHILPWSQTESVNVPYYQNGYASLTPGKSVYF